MSQCKYQALDGNVITHFARISKISFIRTMLCALTGQCAHQTCLQFEDAKDIYLTEYWHPKSSRLSMSRYRNNRGWLLGTNSPELFGVCKASASPTLWLLWDTHCWQHSHLSNVTFKAIFDSQRNYLSSFENSQLIYAFCVKSGNTL